MNVSIDIQPAITQRAGVGRYTKQLVQNLPANRGADTLSLVYFDFMRRAIPFDTGDSVQKAVRICPGRVAQLAWKKLGWPPYNSFAGKADVYHFPNFIIPPLSYGKAVVTIHDMSFIRHPAFAEEENLRYLADRINDTVSRADAIITDSHFSAEEIHSIMDIDKEKIFPIHLGVNQTAKDLDPADVAATLHKINVDRPYLLTVGTLEPRKNIPFLIETFEHMIDFDGMLVIAGMPGWKYEPIIERIKTSPKASRIKYLKYVDDRTLSALYAGSELFVTTSIYEGFGLPPLEAMSCGTPVVSSDGGSLPEVLGSAAKVIKGFVPHNWRDGIMDLLNDSKRRSEMSEAGKEHVKQFTWERTAEETWKVYRSLA
ncbi:hypothetical protein BVX97_05620 [bacterium E08(2017)]|nr:hypothetical protein BVX97_05620 [bacterium E08(2017)]